LNAPILDTGEQGCSDATWVSKGAFKPSTFMPSNLSTDNWVESMRALGARHAVLTAKHQCGFLLWDSEVTLPDGAPYAYGVGRGEPLAGLVGGMIRAGVVLLLMMMMMMVMMMMMLMMTQWLTLMRRLTEC
jgi:hypothetical protein